MHRIKKRQFQSKDLRHPEVTELCSRLCMGEGGGGDIVIMYLLSDIYLHVYSWKMLEITHYCFKALKYSANFTTSASNYLQKYFNPVPFRLKTVCFVLIANFQYVQGSQRSLHTQYATIGPVKQNF